MVPGWRGLLCRETAGSGGYRSRPGAGPGGGLRELQAGVKAGVKTRGPHELGRGRAGGARRGPIPGGPATGPGVPGGPDPTAAGRGLFGERAGPVSEGVA